MGARAAADPDRPLARRGGRLQSLFVLSATAEARDPYTGGHLWRGITRPAARSLCPSCGAELRLAGDPRQRRADPTGRTGTAAERVPRMDYDLLAALAADIGPLLHAG